MTASQCSILTHDDSLITQVQTQKTISYQTYCQSPCASNFQKLKNTKESTLNTLPNKPARIVEYYDFSIYSIHRPAKLRSMI